MESFRWDECFLTGFSDVDSQHQRLVELINRLGELLEVGSAASVGSIRGVLGELTNYTHYHFSEEEAVMEDCGLDTRHLTPHREAHSHFIEVIEEMAAGLTRGKTKAAEELLKFLTHWLSHHILGTDKSMARQLGAIESGVSAASAYDQENASLDSSTGPLLRALNGLFELVTSRNRELSELNRTLEGRVEERTHRLSEANAQLEALAMTDVLTGLPNRRHALSALGREWEGAQKAAKPLACMMIDADGFKQVNDTAGHDAGDEVLKQLARSLQHAVRTDDIVARLGGDEFLIICPDTDLEGGLQVAEKVRATVAELRVPAGQGEWGGSISVGVSVMEPTMSHHEELVKAADQAVYLAKKAGRNCVKSAARPVPTPVSHSRPRSAAEVM